MFEKNDETLRDRRIFITKALILPFPLMEWGQSETARLFLLSYFPAMEAFLHLTDTGMCGKFWSGAHLRGKSECAATPGSETWVERQVLHEHRKWMWSVFDTGRLVGGRVQLSATFEMWWTLAVSSTFSISPQWRLLQNGMCQAGLVSDATVVLLPCRFLIPLL